MQEDLIWIIKQLQLSLEQFGKFQMKAMHISLTQGAILFYLFSQKGQAVYATDLHAALNISRATISATLKQLQEKGYLILEKCLEDDRKKRIVLADKAYAIENALHNSIQEQHHQLCQAIPAQRLQWLRNDLLTMLCNIRTG